jgi:hypothetical protein
MLECLVLGDSIAAGTLKARTECIGYVQGGINSYQWVNKYLRESPFVANTVIISLGSNDHKYIKTESELRVIRELTKADRITYIRNAFTNAMNEKSKFMTPQTVNAKWVKFNSEKVYKSRAKLVKLYNELKEFNKDVSSEKTIKSNKKLIKELNSKIKSTIGIKHKLDKKALGDVFKKSYINEDLNHSFEFIKQRLIKRLHDELDKNSKKYNENNILSYV